MSSTKDKFLKLSNKINNLNLNLEKEKKQQVENIEVRFQNLQKRFLNFQQAQANKYNMLRQQIANLAKNIDEEKQVSHKIVEQKIK